MINTKLRIIQLIQEELTKQGKDSSVDTIGGSYLLQSDLLCIDSELYTEQGLLSMLMELKDNE